jgi:DNA-binding HxlR family transcriptional regulator
MTFLLLGIMLPNQGAPVTFQMEAGTISESSYLMYSGCDLPYSYDAFMRTCPSHQVLETLSGKWTYLIISALGHGRMRNAELQRKVAGISPKMLAQTLRTLERDGIVTRTVYAEVPPRVDYLLTPLGEGLAGLMDLIRNWAETHVPQIDAARAAHDDRARQTG